MITKPAKNNHNKTSKIANTLIRGDRVNNSAPSDGFGISVTVIGLGVFVVVDVLVDAGNINVIAGKGNSVVVGVSDGVAEGVYVREGVPGVPVWVWVVVP